MGLGLGFGFGFAGFSPSEIVRGGSVAANVAALVAASTGTQTMHASGSSRVGSLVVSGTATNFKPTDISNLFVWFRADFGITLNSGNVSSWVDQGTHGYNASQATALRQPGYSSNGGPNGTAYLNFVGLGGAHALAATVASVAQPFDVFIVSRPSNTSNVNGGYLIDFGSNSCITYQPANISGYQIYDGTNLGPKSVVGGIDYISEGLFNGASSAIALNNGTPTTGQAGGAASATTLTIGNFGALGQEFNGRIYEIVAYNKNLSSTERTNLTRYFGTRYSITVP